MTLPHVNKLVPKYEENELEFYSIMALNCALVVRKVKCASLINFRNCKKRKCNLWDEFSRDFQERNDYLEFLCLREVEGEGKLVYFYDPELLLEKLNQPRAQEILELMGYERNMNVDYYVNRLKSQFNNEFPHEIGLFLGYEPEDVYEFIMEKENKITHKNTYYGYWKVYHNIEGAKKTFSLYDNIRREVASSLACGRCPKKFFLEDKLIIDEKTPMLA